MRNHVARSVLALSVALTACSSGGGSGPAPSGSAAAPAPPEKPVASLFPAEKPVLADFAAASMLPADLPLTVVFPNVAGVLDDLGFAAVDEAAKAALLATIAEESPEISKDLPPEGDLAAFGVALDKPCGVAWLDPDFNAVAFFATVSDEAVLRGKLDVLQKKSHGRRVLENVGDALVLRAKKETTRAVVLRKGVAFWLRSGDGAGKGEEIATALKALTAESDAGSLARDATFRAAADALHFGRHAGLYTSTRALLGGALGEPRRRFERAERVRKGMEELLDGEKKKKKPAALAEIEAHITKAAAEAKLASDALTQIEARNGALAAAVPGLAAGLSLDGAAAKIKAFAVLAKDAPRLLGPVSAKTKARAWPAGAAIGGRLAVDPKLLPALIERVLGGGVDKLTTSRAEAVGLSFEKDVAPLLSGDSEIVWSKSPGDFTLVLGLNDAAKARALWDRTRALPAAQPAAGNGEPKPDPGPDVVEIPLAVRSAKSLFLALRGDALVASTTREGLGLADATANAPARPLPPFLTELFATTDTQAAFLAGNELFLRAAESNAEARRRASLWDLGAMDTSLFSLFGSSKKSEKLRKELDKVAGEMRALGEKQRAAKQKAWLDSAPALGEMGFVLAVEGGGLALYGASVVAEASVKALVARAAKAWLEVGPTSEEGKALGALRKKKQALTDALKEENENAAGELFKGSEGLLGGLTGSDIGSMLGSGGLGDGAAGMGGLGTIGSGRGGGTIGLGGVGTTGRGSSASTGTAKPPPKQP